MIFCFFVFVIYGWCEGIQFNKRESNAGGQSFDFVPVLHHKVGRDDYGILFGAMSLSLTIYSSLWEISVASI